jgi:Tfp pilus assembly PilM family ATPase
MKSSRAVGISFHHGNIQIAEVEQGKKKHTVTVLDEVSSTIDFTAAASTFSAGHPKLEEFVHEIRSAMKENKISAASINFALPAEMVMINIIPVDVSLTGSALTKYLQWEASQFLPHDSLKEYILDFHTLPQKNKFAQGTFLVAVHRGIVGFLQKVASELKMKMSIVDIDQFSTEKTLIANYPEILDHDIVLIGIKEKTIDASVIHDGQMTDYRTFLRDEKEQPLRPILDYLQYLRQREYKTPEAVLLHGYDIPKDLVPTLRKETGIKQTLSLNMFRRLSASKKLLPSYVEKNFKFAAAVGLALRIQ